MGQNGDTAKASREVQRAPAEDASALREVAVAIDPPPRGALGIRDLLDLLEREIAREFPAQTDNRSGNKRLPRRRSRKRA